MKYKNIIYVTPEPIKNMGNFRNYLIENTENLITYHFFHGYSSENSYMEKFYKGKKILKIKFPAFPLKINIIRTIMYWIYLEYILLRYAQRGSFVIVEKPFFLIFNSIISLVKNLKFVFWIGDYYPNSKGFMRIYNVLTDYYNNNLKYVLYESPPLKRIYLSKVDSLKNKYRALVTLGMKREDFTRKKLNKRVKLGFIGVLRPMQGLDLIFDYLSKTKKDVILEIVGSGYYLDYYKFLAKQIGIEEKIRFYGFVKNIKPIIKKWDIGLALYENKSSNISKYCEPVKIKNYLENELPIITTKATYMHEDIFKYKVGEIISEDLESLDKAINKINRDYIAYVYGIERMLKDYDFNKWYEKRFNFMED